MNDNISLFPANYKKNLLKDKTEISQNTVISVDELLSISDAVEFP